MRDLDDFITNIVTKEINEPEGYEKAIRNAFDKNTHKKSSFRKIAVTVCSLIIVITGVVNATDIKEFVIEHFYTANDGIDIAIENGYIDEPKIEPAFSDEIEANINNVSFDAYNTEIGIKNMLMDDYDLNFTFSVKTGKNIDIANFMTVRFGNVLIIDENQNIIYCNYSKDMFDEYCIKNNLDYDFYEAIGYSSLEEYLINKDANSNSLGMVYNIANGRIKPYPKSKKLNISIQDIYMGKDEYYPLNEEPIHLKGNWNIQVDVSEKFSSRESVNYIVKKCPYDDIEVTLAKLDNTGFTFKCTVHTNSVYDTNESPEEKQRKTTEFQQYYYDYTFGRIIPNYITNTYLEDDEGNRYDSPDNGGGLAAPYFWDFSTGELSFQDCFTYTQNTQTDNIKVYLTINLPGDVREVCIELEKEK